MSAHIQTINKTLRRAIPPVVDITPFTISEEPLDSSANPYIWERPMSTELFQFKLHKKIKIGENINHKQKSIDTYLGIPWGRFDAVQYYFPLDLIHHLKQKIQQLKDVANQVKYTLRVHTTVQKENWKFYIPLFEEIGVTNVHSIQYDTPIVRDFNPFRPQKIAYHCLPFQAINTETPGRNKGLKQVSINEKKYLATFKGAHMSHYKSDIRIVLQDVYNKETNKTDIKIDVTNEWFYNKKIFSHFYKPSEINQNKDTLYDNMTIEYNELLSNSVFALCPEGGGINSIRFWEALSVGTIPVILVSDPEIPLMLSIHPDLYKCCFVVFRHNMYSLFSALREKSKNHELIKSMSQRCVDLYQEIRNRNTFENQHNNQNSIFSVII